MKLQKKIKYRSWLVQDREVRRVALWVTAAIVAAFWLPPEVRTIPVTVRNLAVTGTLLTPVWMGATAISRVADYTAETVTLAGFAGLFWSAPATLCENFAEGWGFQSAGVLPFIMLEVLIATLVWLVTAALRAYFKSL